MSTHYLIDPFGDSSSPDFLLGAPIVDTVYTLIGESECTGSLVVRVDDSIFLRPSPDPIINLGTLLAAKYAGIIAAYPGFQHVLYDQCLDATGVNTANSSHVMISSGVTNHCVLPGGHLETQATSLDNDVVPQFVLLYEIYAYASDEQSGRYKRLYQEISSTQVSVNFSNGPITNVVSGQVVNVPEDKQGSEITVIFDNVDLPRYYVGSWAILYTLIAGSES
jgi:hypothetical protein